MTQAETIKKFGAQPGQLFEASEAFDKEGVVIVQVGNFRPIIAETYKGEHALFPPRVWHLDDRQNYVGNRHDIESDGSDFGQFLQQVQKIGANIGAKVFPRPDIPHREIQDQIYEIDEVGRRLRIDCSEKLGDLAVSPLKGSWQIAVNGHRPEWLTPGEIAFVDAEQLPVTQQVRALPLAGPAAALFIAEHERTPYF